ncbi:TolC family protein [Vicingaceae bacterium]|nr:TolC family protein [Vicingaceae bacterium]
MGNYKFKWKAISLGIILFFGLLTSNIAQNKVWTLEECIEYALENNLQIQQNELSQKLAGYDLQQAKYNVLPDVNGFVSHAYNFGQTIDPFTNQFANTQVRSNSFSASSTFTIFNGFRNINTIKRNQAQLKSSQLDLEKMKNDISLNIANSFLGILFNQELLKNAESQLKITQLQIDRIEKQVTAGALPEGSLKDINAQFASEELNVVNAENQLNISKLNLAQLLRLESFEDFEIVSPNLSSFDGVIELISPGALYVSALETMPEVKSAEFSLYSAHKNTQIARSGYLPTLSVSGSIGTGFSGANRQVTGFRDPQVIQTADFTRSGEDIFTTTATPIFKDKPFSDQFSENENKSIRFSLTIPIFNRFSARLGVKRAKIQEQVSDLNYESAKLTLRQNIESAHNDAASALKRYKAAEKSVAALETSFAYTQKRYNVGIINSFDFNNEKNRLINAQSELLQAKYNYIFSTKVLGFYQGGSISLSK